MKNQQKRKKATDKTLPRKVKINLISKIENFVPEAALFQKLVEFEKKLDTTISRKRLEIQETAAKPTKVWKPVLFLLCSFIAIDLHLSLY